MKKTKRFADNSPLKYILIHAQPLRSADDRKWPPGFREGMRALSQTLPGQKRDKQKDVWEAESNWHRNLAFMGGVHALIPPDDSTLRHEAEKLLVKMFGKGYPNNKLERFTTAERRRIRKDGDAAWRFVEKLRKRLGLPPTIRNN